MSEKPWTGRHLLLLSGPMGTGHVQASLALAKYASERYPEMKVTHLNVVELMTPGLKIFFTDYYHFMLRHMSLIWRYMYHSSNVPPAHAPVFRKLLAAWRGTFERRLIKRIKECNPDYIICTHFLPAEVLGRAKSERRINCFTSSVITDFSVHWVYIQTQLDLFFVANHDMSLIMHLRGVGREKIYITGCPILPGFSKSYSDEDKKRLRAELGLPHDANLIMVMMGGENIGRIALITRTLLDNFPGVSVLAMTGRDKKLYQQIEKIEKKYPGRVFPISFTTRVNDYMAICYLVVSKPGGITISECLAMKKPIIVMDPIPGHEEKNAAYLATHGLAAFSESLTDLTLMDAEPGATWMQMVSNNHSIYDRHDAAGKILKVVIEWEGNPPVQN
ncbi:MAG: glycosyltransferase [Victivallaceae bacterium]|jgi:processive 1,2-diacylglycerol beta-glucosyltransferase